MVVVVVVERGWRKRESESLGAVCDGGVCVVWFNVRVGEVGY